MDNVIHVDFKALHALRAATKAQAEAPKGPAEVAYPDLAVRAAVSYPNVSAELANRYQTLKNGALGAMALYLQGQGVKLDPSFWSDANHLLPILGGVIERRLGIRSAMTMELEQLERLKGGASGPDAS